MSLDLSQKTNKNQNPRTLEAFYEDKVRTALNYFAVTCGAMGWKIKGSTLYFPEDGSVSSGFPARGWELTKTDNNCPYVQVGYLSSGEIFVLAWTNEEIFLNRLKELVKALSASVCSDGRLYWGRIPGDFERITWNEVTIKR